ncbi:thymidylate synthase (FAD) [Helicobacter sp. 16-1353]|uniref:FAD-dependent thymidylate synthase n=1 Tax=Helicobacter sp. 16-1353 TaxID=2004996 RepID=UPI000DCB47AC|nr:FAD-dependent thymidylate synthase [Helicobacter sp. 16-1353]RAX54056.1 thymidylate synthase (FAD) [Helicobacter sp. 16-1353]
MKVTLLHYTPIYICSHAIRTCWQSFSKGDCGGEKDLELIDRVGNKFKHASTLEHLYYNFYIQGISRACLQELARHRIASLSVKSTRYTLKELKGEESFLPINAENIKRAKKYVVLMGESSGDSIVESKVESAESSIDSATNLAESIESKADSKLDSQIAKVDSASIHALENLRLILLENTSLDIAKYALIESYKTELTWSINARSLQNFLMLRSSKSALREIRHLALSIYEALPEEHKFIFLPYINEK